MKKSRRICGGRTILIDQTSGALCDIFWSIFLVDDLDVYDDENRRWCEDKS